MHHLIGLMIISVTMKITTRDATGMEEPVVTIHMINGITTAQVRKNQNEESFSPREIKNSLTGERIK